MEGKLLILILIVLVCVESGTTEDRSVIHDKNMPEFLTFAFISISCVLFGGLMSGLTVGLLGIDELELEIKLSNGTPQEKIDARKILAVIDHHHLLLVTLLLANSLAMEALPLFLDEMFNTEITLAISVTFVLAFGEVIPQALCTGKDQIKIAIKMIPLVKFLMIVMFPIAYPIAKLLDCVLKHDSSGVKLKSDDLKTFISLHESFAKGNDAGIAALERFQINMMHSVIDFNKLKLKEVMQPYSNFAKISIDEPVNKQVVEKIVISHYHYLPVYRQYKSNVLGVIRIQELFKIWEGEIIENSDIVINDPMFLNAKMTILMALKQMEAAQCSIAFVLQENQEKKKVTGVVTKESILAKLLTTQNLTEREEISDISHALVDSLHKGKTNTKTKGAMRENLI